MCEETLNDELDFHDLIIKMRQLEAMIQDESLLYTFDSLRGKLQKVKKLQILLDGEIDNSSIKPKFSQNFKKKIQS